MIDQATGVIAERFACSIADAQRHLRRLAADHAQDITVVAAALITHPGTPAPAPSWEAHPYEPRSDVFDPTRYVHASPGGDRARVRPRLLHATRAGTPGALLDVADPGGVQHLLDMIPAAVAVLAPIRDSAGHVVDYVIQAASPEAADVAGRRGRDMVGLRILDCYPSVAESELWTAYQQVLDTGQPREIGPFTYTDDDAGVPARAEFSVHAHLFGTGLLIAWARHDQQRRQAEQLHLIQQLGNLGWTEWDLSSNLPEWSQHLYTIFDRAPADGPVTLDQLPALVVPDDLPALEEAVVRLLHHGQRIEVDYRIHTPAGRVKHLHCVADAVCDATGTPVQVYAVFQDVTIAEQLRRQLADTAARLAEHQRHLRTEHDLTVRLQQIILPTLEAPLQLPGMQVAVRYLPAEQLTRVGGDWYHAAPLANGDILLAVGDTAGHGIAAAATMARLQHALAALAITTGDPSELLRHLNRLLSDTSDVTASALVGCYRPAGRTLTWSQAGHPPPLLAHAGTAGPLPRPKGMLLGARPDSSYATASITLAPDDVLLLYTDGLIEHRTGLDLDDGVRHLATAFTKALASPASASQLDDVIAGLRQANPDDDTCILAARPSTATTPSHPPSRPG